MSMQSVGLKLTCGSWYLDICALLVSQTCELEAAAFMFGIILFDNNSDDICDAEIKISGSANYSYLLRFGSMRARY